MTPSRTELAGTGASVALHAGLLAALSLSLAKAGHIAEPPTMQVELVDEIALDSAAPSSTPSAPPASADEAPDAVPEPDAPSPAPAPAPTPTPVKAVQPTPRKEVPVKAQPARPVPRTAPRTNPRPGRDPLAASPLDQLAPSATPGPAAPRYDAKARASVGQLIARQVQPCADRQPYLGDGASDIVMTVALRFNRDGRLASAPDVTGMRGDAELRRQYGNLLEDQVIRIFRACSPLNLPADLYDTPAGGWNRITINYRIGQ